MKIALTYNLRLSNLEEEAEFDTVETLNNIEQTLIKLGHEVMRIEVGGPVSHLVTRLEAYNPDLIFNLAEGRKGKMREAFYPALFEELNYPYTGSEAYTLAITLDKMLTKTLLAAHGIESPKGRLFTSKDIAEITRSESSFSLPFPCLVKPNFEGSSKGINYDCIAKDIKSLKTILLRMLEQYPQGVLAEEFIPGFDITIPFLNRGENLNADCILQAVDYIYESQPQSKSGILDYRLKLDLSLATKRCPADIPRDTSARLRSLSKNIVKIVGLKDMACMDFRVTEDGRIFFLEVNGLPSLAQNAPLFAATRRDGLSYDQTIAMILESAAIRWKLLPANKPKAKSHSEPLRIGFTYNIKSADSKLSGDAEAEYDSPQTIASIQSALESMGHEVVLLEANGELPSLLLEAKVDLVFNIAEGLSGRNREAQVPALCELCGIPYTGSDSATLALALDKALTKRILIQHNVPTPEFQVMTTGRERLSTTLKFPLIIKPIAEGSSKGVGQKGVVDDEASLRTVVRELIDKYRQPALIEEYITGREFTVGLLGDKRPRVLPPMEICFKNKDLSRPVYDYDVKQEWEKHVYYACPAPLTPVELKAVEKAARDTFQALDCRDVARVDLRMNEAGVVYVLEVNPLPGLTPDYSDLVLIAKAAGMDYRTLIAEILAGGLKRLREKRREGQSLLTKPSNTTRSTTGNHENLALQAAFQRTPSTIR